MSFTVECGVEHYRIIGPNGEQGERVCWDGIATLKIGNEIYYCDGDSDADEQEVQHVVSIFTENTAVEDVLFDDETPEDDDGAEGDDEDDEVLGPELVEHDD